MKYIRILLDNWEKLAAFFTGLSVFLAFGYKFVKWGQKVTGWVDRHDTNRDNVNIALEKMDGNMQLIMGRQSSFMDEMHTAMFESNKEGICINVNRAWCRMTGLDHDSAIGNGWARVIHPDDLPMLKQVNEDFINYGKTLDVNYRMIHFKDKKIFTVRATGKKHLDDNGKTVTIIGTVTKVE